MGAGEIIAICLTAVIIGLAILYIIKAKKSGKKCIGCPYAQGCGKKNCTCSEEKEQKKGQN